jgi:hypothetical protein
MTAPFTIRDVAHRQVPNDDMTESASKITATTINRDEITARYQRGRSLSSKGGAFTVLPRRY